MKPSLAPSVYTADEEGNDRELRRAAAVATGAVEVPAVRTAATVGPRLYVRWPAWYSEWLLVLWCDIVSKHGSICVAQTYAHRMFGAVKDQIRSSTFTLSCWLLLPCLLTSCVFL
jgi:hypothetical protein